MHFRQPVFVSFFFGTAIAVWAADDSKPVALAEAPPAVQKTIAAQITDGKLGGIGRTEEDGESVFEIAFTSKTGIERGFSVADDGMLLSVDVTMAETPAPVQKTIRALATGWQLEGIYKNVDEEEISFDVEVAKDGREKTLTIAEDGDLLGAGVLLAETPPPVQATITRQVADGSLEGIDENFDPDGNSFDVAAVTKKGDKRSFCVGADGKMLSEEVTLEQVPPAPRKTITDQIGAGKLLRIDESLFEKVGKGKGKGKVMPYEVQARKDGKPFDFNVAPEGKFLGMDD